MNTLFFKDNLILRDLLNKQITHLNFDIKKPAEYCSKTVSKILVLILSLCEKLTDLNFGDMFLTRKCLTGAFNLRSENIMSSTLIKLKINVSNFLDCLFLLDGRFESLSTLIINVADIFDPVIDIGGRVSQISIIMFTQETVNQITFVFFRKNFPN
jgi:hypothetical protein